ncbi:MAG: M48 family metalloprotease [Candidatus Eremiobacteraeota bacterium]|nr:M48 family metalloprotease [Candidatus Eremiobacteraeota bacterium]
MLTSESTPVIARIAAALLATAFILQATVAPALAMSTATEISEGTAENAEIDSTSIVISDPFLTSWTNQVGANLAKHRKRQDITYRFTVLDDPSINAFAIKGGYVHVNVGLLNFVSSDDELAATLGHEMGHVEMRHVVKGSNVNTVIGILTAIAAIVSPVASVLGALGGELATDKYSRSDELQADHYGLSLMAQAGYDPNAAIDVMTKLGQMDAGPESRADKAFLDHPVPSDRVSHLAGYPELDRESGQSLLADAIHDQSEGRYSYARSELTSLTNRDDAQVAEHIAQLDYALRESGPKAAPDGRVFRTAVDVNDPARISAIKAIKGAQVTAAASTTEAKAGSRKGFDELQQVVHKLNVLQSGAGPPNLRWAAEVSSASPQPSATPGPSASPAGGAPSPGGGLPPVGPTRTTATGMATLEKLITGTLNPINDVLATAPGLTVGNSDALHEMLDPLMDDAPLTPKFQALLAYYPAMISDLNGSTKGLQASIELARGAIAQANDAVAATRAALEVPPPQNNGMGTPAPRPPPDLHAALTAWTAAMQTARRAQNVMYAAQSATLSSEITMLDVLSSPERYAAYRKALAFRFPGVDIPDYQTAIALGVRPGELACAAWAALETGKSIQTVVGGIKASGRSCEANALDDAMMTESMEIALGLVYEDYVDEPQHRNVTAKSSG